MTLATLRKYLLPGLLFQSVVIAGGYGTGRELVEFFLTFGPTGGILGMLLVSMVIWSAVNAASLEFARVFRAHDYGTFFKELLGPAGFLFEVCYVLLLMVVLAIIAAAAGSILLELFGWPYWVGVVGMMLAVGFLVFRGTDTIEKFLAGWSGLLYLAYVIFFVMAVSRFGPDIARAFAEEAPQKGWFLGGVRYAAYNLAVIPAVLFSVRHLETRREAVTAGLLAGPIGIIPGLLFFIAMSGHYPDILTRDIPSNYMLDLLGSRTFQIGFQIVLFGTLIETGTGLIHAINERIRAVFAQRQREMPQFLRPAVAAGLLILGIVLAQVGIKRLIAQGYGYLTWAFLVIYVIPILTVGIWKIRASQAVGTGT